MAGDERIMSNASLLMIHNAWLYTAGDPNQLRKDADDLETINQASVNAYMSRINITEEALKEMMDAETWIAPADALEMGFATAIIDDTQNKKAAGQSIKKKLTKMIIAQQKRNNRPSNLNRTQNRRHRSQTQIPNPRKTNLKTSWRRCSPKSTKRRD